MRIIISLIQRIIGEDSFIHLYYTDRQADRQTDRNVRRTGSRYNSDMHTCTWYQYQHFFLSAVLVSKTKHIFLIKGIKDGGPQVLKHR